jgi:carbon monoxide dehydrogenase subunit G
MRTPLLLVCVVGVGSGGAVATAEDRNADEPIVSEALASGVYALEGTFEVAADVHSVWQVLTDYDHLSRFVPSVRKSVAHVSLDGGLLVEQELVAKALVFSRTLRVRLDVREEPEERIDFHDVAVKDFDIYRGSWTIAETATGSKVIYLLSAKPHETLPEFVARGAFKDSALKMLGQLRSEITRRSLGPASSPGPQSQKGGS